MRVLDAEVVLVLKQSKLILPLGIVISVQNIELWLLAVALAMDCFTVSIVFGVLLRKIEWRTILVVAFLFGLFQAMMPLAGWLATNSFSSLIEDYDHWIAFGLLAFLGGRMIKESTSRLNGSMPVKSEKKPITMIAVWARETTPPRPQVQFLNLMAM